jgi:hypothetical protein
MKLRDIWVWEVFATVHGCTPFSGRKPQWRQDRLLSLNAYVQ